MAELFLALEQATQRRVVIKRILPYLAEEEDFVRMFLDEARIASQLHHPNIIQVYELGNLDRSIFIAMEYVDGIDLRRMLQEELKLNRVIPYRLAAYATSKVCAGLFYAHNAVGRDGKPMGIVHRDVSPQNVMVGQRGEVKLVDFGIAKAGALVERSKPGVIKGKFLYLAPEQLAQERVDHRADLFAFGTMLYEITTGKSPFYKPTTEAVIYAVRMEDPPPPQSVRPDYPLALSRVVMKCLAKDRARRYQSAEEVKNDLEAYLRTEERTDDGSLRDYLARLLGTEDESTVLVDPSQALSFDPSPPKEFTPPRSTAPIGRRPTPSELELKVSRELLPEPRTAAEGPHAKAYDRKSPTAPTERRPSGPKPPLSHKRTASMLPPMSSGEFKLDEGAGSLLGRKGQVRDQFEDELPSGSSELSEDAELESAEAEEDLSPTLARWGQTLSDNPLALGGLALVGVVLAGVLIYSLFAPSDRRDPSNPRPLSREAVVPREVEPAPNDEGAAVDAGAAAGSMEPAVTLRVMVTFRAPPGTRIWGSSVTFVPGTRYPLPPGPHKVVYRCPGRKGKKTVDANLAFNVTPQPSGVQTVRICK